MSIQRHYVTVGDRQVHYRRAGSGPPVVLLHESPQSSALYAELAERLATEGFTVLALDTPGYGESDALALDAPDMADYADALAETLTALGIDRAGVHGAHTGASIALELGARHPERVAALVLDGLLLPTDEERRSQLEHYTPRLDPQPDGSHLVRAWWMRRDMWTFWPWYERTDAARLDGAVADPETLHLGMLEYLRAGSGFDRGYRAAFTYDPLPALRGLTVPAVIVASPDDSLSAQLDRFASGLPVSAGLRARDLGEWAQELAGHFAAAREERDTPAAPAATPIAGRLTRTYVSTPQGQLLLRWREDGDGRPLVLVHGSPVSGWAMEPLMARLAPDRPVYAFDTLGNGDSDKPDASFGADIPDFARVLVAAIDGAGLDRLDLYGTHTGAAIAIEAALALGDRVGAMILDGIGMFDEATVAEYLERYFVDLTPRWDGGHLLTAWHVVRDSTLWFPWYKRDGAHRCNWEVWDADALHPFVLEFLKSGTSYPLSYSAAFRYPAAERLPLVHTRTLIGTTPEDPLWPMVVDAVRLCPGAAAAQLPADGDAVAALLSEFLDEEPARV